jgi:hypothetical protein
VFADSGWLVFSIGCALLGHHRTFHRFELDLVPVSHSRGVNVEKAISDALEGRNINTERIVAITSDAGSDVRKGCVLFGNPQYLCILHGIQNAQWRLRWIRVEWLQ